MNNEEKQLVYLKGYREGFEAAQKVIWAFAEELYISIPNQGKADVKKFINKISS